MDNTEKKIRSDESDKNNHPNDYTLLVQKLKNISMRIHFLEQNFLNKKI